MLTAAEKVEAWRTARRTAVKEKLRSYWRDRDKQRTVQRKAIRLLLSDKAITTIPVRERRGVLERIAKNLDVNSAHQQRKESPVPKKPELQWLGVDKLFIDSTSAEHIFAGDKRTPALTPGYQRDPYLRRIWCEQQASTYDEALFKPIEVSLRRSYSDGRYAIIDGGGRWLMAQMLCLKKVLCRVHHSLTPEQEAILFFQMDSKVRRLQPVQKFNALVKAGLLMPMAINDTLKQAGYHVGNGRNGIPSVAAVERVFEYGTLQRAAFFCRNVWDGMRIAGTTFNGLGMFMKIYEKQFDEKSLRSLLKNIPPKDLDRRVRNDFGRLHPDEVPKRIAAEIVKEYNYRRQKQRLDPDLVVEFAATLGQTSSRPRVSLRLVANSR